MDTDVDEPEIQHRLLRETAAGEDWRPFDQAREVLLAAAAKSGLTRRLFGAMVRRIAALPGAAR